MVDKDAKVREMRRENLLLTSKIQLLEDQMENLNERVDRKLRERSQTRRDLSSLRYDSNLSIEVKKFKFSFQKEKISFSLKTTTRSSSTGTPTRITTYNMDGTSWNQPIHHKESFGFGNVQHQEILPS